MYTYIGRMPFVNLPNTFSNPAHSQVEILFAAHYCMSIAGGRAACGSRGPGTEA